MNSSETPGEPLNILMLVDSLGIGGTENPRSGYRSDPR